ncbi:MAG: D-alanyl-D-alanine carboxypeptidase [Lactobacillus helsingborgensis]|nr:MULTISPECIES: serine hydrolase [Lactobacillus]MCT6812507.1 D-alanyl-D-alanine carboxypeptidase [Lactobacillus helsingborgensis]MCT6827271.1 D-alanyl-D-alanine carboxypeptidase [Lactobacillus helsingborgensis]MCT6847223.1 D-alanyl-D-alanine carboxypeptidase [Lactobacillus helsingborgensis]UZX30958.1 D-alanyl-D-alanine carboxypeptidase [Lactobacillus helsingborgensis]
MKHKVKALILTFISLFLLMAPVNTVAAAKKAPDNYDQDKVAIDAKAAIAIDSETGQVLYGKNINQPLPIASMTKLITAYLTLKAIDENKINWDTRVTPTRQIFAVASNREYSNVPLRMKHTYTIRQLYQATLIESANGAAMMLAQAISGSQTAFVRQMRRQLQKWDIKDGRIYTTCGLPNKSVGSDAYPGAGKNAENMLSAKDMALVGLHLLQDYPNVINTTKIAKLNFVDQDFATPMSNFNWMLKGMPQYRKRLKIDGLKTGTTDAAGACFIATAKHKGGRIITVVMGAKHETNTDPARFIQTAKLLDYVYQNYQPLKFKRNEVIIGKTNMAVHNGQARQINIGMKNDSLIWVPQNGQKFTIELAAKQIEAPIKSGQKVNSYIFKKGNQKIISLLNPAGLLLPAQALQSTNKVNIFVRFWRWLFGG